MHRDSWLNKLSPYLFFFFFLNSVVLQVHLSCVWENAVALFYHEAPERRIFTQLLSQHLGKLVFFFYVLHSKMDKVWPPKNVCEATHLYLFEAFQDTLRYLISFCLLFFVFLSTFKLKQQGNTDIYHQSVRAELFEFMLWTSPSALLQSIKYNSSETKHDLTFIL